MIDRETRKEIVKAYNLLYKHRLINNSEKEHIIDKLVLEIRRERHKLFCDMIRKVNNENIHG